MQVERARVMGRCMGVRRAEDLALKAAAEAAGRGGRVLTLGPLIHNPQAVAALEAAGVGMLDEKLLGPDAPAGCLAGVTVVVRAHGAPPEALARLATLGADVVDATCPRVLASQRRARKWGEQGRLVIVAGDAGHGEVKGILGQAPGAVTVANVSQAEDLAARISGRDVAILAQTTISDAEYEDIKAVFNKRFPGIESFGSICPAAREHQEALVELSGRVDAIVVVGGKGSANTVRLAATARASGKPVWHIETAAGLPAEIFGYGRVGLTAGASTPDELVDEVEAALLAGNPRAGEPRPAPPADAPDPGKSGDAP